MLRKKLPVIILSLLPDIAFLPLLIYKHESCPRWLAPLFICYSIVRFILLIKIQHVQSKKTSGDIKKALNSFKRGTFSARTTRDKKNDILTEIDEVGYYLEDLVTSQREEIKKFRELYNNVVLSASSYFIVFDDKNRIIFANENFCKKFNYSVEEVTGSNLGEIFYLISNSAFDRIEDVKNNGETHVISQVRILSRTKVAIVADLKISTIKHQGQKQIFILMEDVTTRCKKDHQITLLSQISESINRDSELEKVLHAILTAVTTGAGLGFNRAMLFLYDNETKELRGELAVGPDSLEEAIEIWEKTGEEGDIVEQITAYEKKERNETELNKLIKQTKYSESEDNILFQAIKSGGNYHVKEPLREEEHSSMATLLNAEEFIIAPLFSGKKTIGVLVVDNKFNQAPIVEDSIELLSIFAAQAALSIENASQLTTVRSQVKNIQEKQSVIVESEKMAAVGRIAAHIAHEIRNPLVTMGGYARRILNLVGSTTKPVAKKSDSIKNCADVILEESDRLEKILSNVMDFTRPAPLMKDYNSINQVIQETLSLMKNALEEKKISVKLNLDETLPMIKSDFKQLKQVMLNLIQNVMEVTEGDGALEIISRKEKNKIKIIVSDTGPGVKEEDVEHLFDPFFTTKITGVGLGLAIVKKIINDHNGEIRFQNTSDGGSFEINFRISQSNCNLKK